MFEPLRRLFRASPPLDRPRIPAGERTFVIGDIHGRLDLFQALASEIEREDERRGPARTTVILLGDLIDRGPDSAGVIAKARHWQAQRDVRILMGNHEEMFLDSFERESVLRHFLKHGGRETLISYGIDQKLLTESTVEELREIIDTVVPQDDRDFVAGFESTIEQGDYLFVHAGIDPSLPMEAQSARDMRWIREPFLTHEKPHSHVVVHGHTIVPEIVEKTNRIGIDTGAYRFGRLTALVLEGEDRAYIQAIEPEGGGTITFDYLAHSVGETAR
ncbi:metallophosphoesterase family protein [Qipengyuania sp. JC766]|uniref:metallophosphoesterase family protein n=1 Tax=Qipengyuania sp. JC766 TaxID=3232139 RepID=UPI00345984FF